ncbi:MAG: anti-sigma factor domain-containing protein [Actinobacteria bacterium]|nr:anti-sigma factor domain-containing protein [Actinomycetota bacterium]
MKAIILEIYRKYCILMTKDGQFLRKNIPAGLYEIGDEIIIDRFEEVTVSKRGKLPILIGRVASGLAAVVLIIIGLYFGVEFLKNQKRAGVPAVSAAQAAVIDKSLEVAEDTFMLESENGMQENIPGEEMASELVLESKKASRDQSSDTLPAENKLFEGSYSLENAGINIPIAFASINIIYRVDEAKESLFDFFDEERKLNFNFENINKKASFNGNIDISLLNSELDITKTHTILFNDFSSGQEKSEEIPLLDELSFRLIMYGFFK